MFAWVGNRFDIVLDQYVLDVVTRLAHALAIPALACLTLWIALFGWAVLRNEVPETVPTFVWRVFKVSLVFTFALNAAFYISNVSESANSLAVGVAAAFQPASLDPDVVTTPFVLLDTFNDKASQLVLDLLKEASITRLDLVFAAIVTSFGNVIFLCIALFVITLSKVLLTFVLGVGPIFILCLAWKPTARFFDSWLSMLLNTVVLTWFSFFALGLSMSMGDAMLQVIQDQGGFLGPTFNVVGESLRYCIVMILMAIICFQAPSLAAALTGGAVVQQGIQMIQNTMIANGLRSPNKNKTEAGGAIRAGVGAPYAAGQAAGAIVGAAARQASAAKRIPAYLMASIRARR